MPYVASDSPVSYMSAGNVKKILLRAKEAIIEDLHGTYHVPKIDADSLKPSPERQIGEGGFANVYAVSFIRPSLETEQSAMRSPDVDVVAVKVLKEHKISQRLAHFPRPYTGRSKKRRQKQDEDRALYEDNAKIVIEKLLQYYKRECVIWEQCSGDGKIAKENNIVELFGLADSYQGSRMPTFVSRHISEGSVTNYIKDLSKPPLSNKERILIISDIAKALCFLHDLGIVHRDIKGNNILIEMTDGRFVGLLGDFGSSKILEGDFLQNMSSTMNEDRWIPPEYLLERRARHDEKGPGDIWSLGCTLLEVLQEEEPWKPLSSEAFKEKLCSYEYPIRGDMIESTMTFRHVEDSCYEFMKKCWRKEKSDRISANEAHRLTLQLAYENE